jgi:hypothetical protein
MLDWIIHVPCTPYSGAPTPCSFPLSSPWITLDVCHWISTTLNPFIHNNLSACPQCFGQFRLLYTPRYNISAGIINTPCVPASTEPTIRSTPLWEPCKIEIPLLLSFLYLFSKAESGAQAPFFWNQAPDLAPGAIRSEDSVRRGVWLGRYICQKVTQVS